MIGASVTLLLVGVGLLTVGLVTGATPALLTSVVVALAALAPLGVAVVRARPSAGDRDRLRADPTATPTDPPTDPAAMDPAATDPASGGPPADLPPPDRPTA